MNSKYMVIVAAMAVMLIGATALATTDSAFASKKREYNQATSQANACGNGNAVPVPVDSTSVLLGPINIGCQNTNSQIQGDENAVGSTAQQTFPELD